ncbi:MAG: C cytochrome precursor [Planctomycetes bacterium]|nr:C cytochrome precursor [Planctomycetota bacterium]
MLDALLTSLVAIAAVLPLWALCRRARGGLAFASVATLAALTVAALSFTAPPPNALPTASRPELENGQGYVGSAACRSCHPGEHASWHASFHRTMTQVATRAVIADEFERRELDWFGSPLVLEWRGDRLWVEFDRRGRDPRHVERPVEQTTGSHHLQVLWYSTGNQRELAPVPLCFELEQRIWLPLTSVFVLPPEFRDPPEPGAWNTNCHMCHATNVRPRVDIGRCDTQVTELGIACEACHGPGRDHVAANKNPLRRYAQKLAVGGDDTIVQPGRLDSARSAEVCGQCHSVNILQQEHFDSWREEGLRYRPGDQLRATNLVIDQNARGAAELRRTLAHNPHFFESSFWSDGQVRVSGREYNGLVMSPCYTHADAERRLQCTSCHALHRDDDPAAWRDDQLRPGMRGNVACTQCHEQFTADAALTAHTHHPAASSGSVCYNCHMNPTTFGLMKAERNHTISSPNVQSELATGRPNACSQCHLDRTSLWAAEQLEAKWGIAPPALDPATDRDRREIAASVRWLLSGDAGQRALAAWSMGWQPAQDTAGRDWLAPYLARLLDDPYYVVRFNAARSLRTLGFAADLESYEFLAEPAAARRFGELVHSSWRSGYRGGDRPALLLGSSGTVAPDFARLFAQRDDRPIYLAE